MDQGFILFYENRKNRYENLIDFNKVYWNLSAFSFNHSSNVRNGLLIRRDNCGVVILFESEPADRKA